MRRKRIVAYLGCATVIVACVGTAHHALHPSPASPDAILVWPYPQLVLRPLLPEHALETTLVAHWNPVWPPDPSTAAVPFFDEMIELLIATAGNDKPSAASGIEARAQASQPQRLAAKPLAPSETTGELGWPFGDPPEASNARDARAQQWSERRPPSKKNR